ncbi:MAG: hypothetical protein CBB84_005410 [Phycisphaera sp. TMED24]|nr:MAG: hypothetical protein CBB84_005410 [Phycisphaera sp. TMED24]
MLAELLVPIFLPGLAFLAVLLVLKPEHRGRWSGLVGGCVLPLATLVGFVYEGAWPSSFSDWHRLPLILAGAGLLSAGLCWLPLGVQRWSAPLALGALAGVLGAFPDMETSDQCLLGLSVVVSVKWWMLASEATLGRLVGLGAWASCVALAPMALDGGFTTLMILSASGATIAGALVLAPQSLTPSGGGAMLLGVLLPLLAWCGCSYDYAEAPWWQWAGVAGLPVAIILFLDPAPSTDGHPRRPWLTGFIRAIFVVVLLGWLLQPTLDSLVAPTDDPYGSY